MDTKVLERLCVEALSGIPKSESLLAPLTPAQSQMWDRIIVQGEEIKAKGGIIDIVHEIPEVEVPKAVE